MQLRKTVELSFSVATVALFSLLLLFVRSPAACPFTRPPVVSEINQADLVFRGRLISYTPLPVTSKTPDKRSVIQEATIMFAVVETLRGPEAKIWSIRWEKNDTIPIPSSWDWGQHVIIAAKRAPIDFKPELFVLLKKPCSNAFILPDKKEILEEIRGHLKKP